MKKENITIGTKVNLNENPHGENIPCTVIELRDTSLIVQQLNDDTTDEVGYNQVFPYILSKDEFTNIINDELKNSPKYYRKGQAIFNIIDSIFGVARTVQFLHNVDCFYNDDAINDFIDTSYNVYSNYLIDNYNNL